MTRLHDFHARLRAHPLIQRFTLLTRTLLALGFIAPGLTKLTGRAFAPGIDPTHPMGAFFMAFHEASGYYVFVGLIQALAGGLLLFRRTALLGACMYFAIMVNIFTLVTATRFGAGTMIVTGLMTLACLWLLGWDAHRLAPLFGPEVTTVRERQSEPPVWDALSPVGAQNTVRSTVRAAYAVGFAGLLGFTLGARGLFLSELTPVLLFAVLAGALLTVVAWGWHALQPRLTD